MKYFALLTIISTFFGCISGSKHVEPPVAPEKGDYWVNRYHDMHISSSTIVYKDNKLYCSTMNTSNNSETFYCLDLESGKVLWKNKVSSHSSYPPIVLDDVIYYVSYLADRYAFDNSGKEIWHKNTDPQNLIAGNFTFNAVNHDLIVSDIDNGFYQFDKVTGNLKPAPIIDGWKRTSFLPVYNSKYMYYMVSPDSTGISPNTGTGLQLICRNLEDNRTIWQIPLISTGKGLYARDGNVYMMTSNTIYAINGSDGNENWVNYLGPDAHIDQHWNRSGFMKDQIQAQIKNSISLAIDYKTGKIIPHYTKSAVINYILTDNYQKKYNVNVTIGSFRGNNDFDNNTEVKVDMIDDKK